MDDTQGNGRSYSASLYRVDWPSNIGDDIKKILFFLLLSLTACSVPSTIRLGIVTPLASPQNVQATPEIASVTVGQLAAQATSTPLVDAIATQSQLLSQLAASQADTASLQAQLADAKAEAVTVKLQIAEAERETAKYNAATTANGEKKSKVELELIKEQNRKLELENKGKELENARLQLVLDIETAKKQKLLILFVGVLGACGLLIGAWIIKRRVHILPAQEQKLPQAIFMNAEKWTRPPHAPASLAEFVAWARVGLDGESLAFENIVGNHKLYSSWDAYRPLKDWAEKWKVVEMVKGKLVLSPNGKTYCAEVTGLSPSPEQSVPLLDTATPSGG